VVNIVGILSRNHASTQLLNRALMLETRRSRDGRGPDASEQGRRWYTTPLEKPCVNANSEERYNVLEMDGTSEVKFKISRRTVHERNFSIELRDARDEQES